MADEHGQNARLSRLVCSLSGWILFNSFPLSLVLLFPLGLVLHFLIVLLLLVLLPYYLSVSSTSIYLCPLAVLFYFSVCLIFSFFLSSSLTFLQVFSCIYLNSIRVFSE